MQQQPYNATLETELTAENGLPRPPFHADAHEQDIFGGTLWLFLSVPLLFLLILL